MRHNVSVPGRRYRVDIGEIARVSHIVTNERVVPHQVRPVEVDASIEHRQFDVLPTSAAFPREQRRSNTLRGSQRGDLVVDDGAHQLGWSRRGLCIGYAAQALNDVVVHLLFDVRPDLADTRDRRVDQLWIDCAQRLIPEPDALHTAGAIVLQQHIRARHQP